MSPKLLLTLLCFLPLSITRAQEDKNPVLKNTYNSYFQGKLVGIGNFSNETELKTTNISISEVISLVEDYTRNFRSYPYSNFSDLLKSLEQKDKKIENLQSDYEKLERKLNELERKIR